MRKYWINYIMVNKIISFSWVAVLLGAHLHYQRIMYVDYLLVVDTLHLLNITGIPHFISISIITSAGQNSRILSYKYCCRSAGSFGGSIFGGRDNAL